ncbi:MAG: LysR family transcriptional regulator [Clostridiales bacterium]|nr:LysR family transcriptional regulator [Clostridiales bacterium]
MNILQVQCVLSLSQTLSFTQSSLDLHISQSSFSRQIAALEQELGVTLFKRNRRRVELTESGQLLLPEFEAIAAHYERAKARLSTEENAFVGNLRIGILSDLTNRIAPKLVNQFRRKYPNITLFFREFSHTSLLEALHKDVVDIAFISSTDTDKLKDIDFYVLQICDNAVVTSLDHPFSNRESIDIQDLRNETFIIIDQRESTVISGMTMQQCLSGGFVPKYTINAKQIPSLLFMVSCGQGIAILPIDNRHFFSHDLRYIPLSNDNCKIKRLVAWKKNNPNASLPLFITEAEKFHVC